MSQHFESDGTDGMSSFGYNKTPEQLASEKAEKAASDAENEAFWVQRRRELAAEKSALDKQNREREEKNLEERAVEVCLSANPNFSETEARRFYNHHFRQLIAIERFRTAFFGNSDAAKKMFDDLHM
jgi:hypothetical protein